VVGAGMSGLYSTWRILQKDPGAEILIFERSNRTGGRLNSDVVEFEKEKVKEEEGGMRFTFDRMDNLMSLLLIFELDKQVVPFPMSGSGTNRLCFRGRSFTREESQANNYAIWSELYNLAPCERHINPGGIVDTIFNRILAANPEFKERPEHRTPDFWQKFRLECKWKDVKLIDWSLWNLCTDMGYSGECIQMMYGLSGFNGTFLSRMNAGEAFQLLEDFPANPDFHTLENGFSALPNALVDHIAKLSQGKRIHLNTKVDSIVSRDKEGYVVQYTPVDSDPSQIKPQTIKARKLILALPRLPLEKLFVTSPVLNAQEDGKAEILWDTLQTSTNQSLLKINLYYDRAWWGDGLTGQESVGYGPNFSDLPLGSVYPFYAIDPEAYAALEYSRWLQDQGKQPTVAIAKKLKEIDKKKYHKPAALTIYCDYMNINFWKALQENGEKFDSPKQQEFAKSPQTLFPASEAVVEAATAFFRQLFDTNDVPRPVLTSARIWDGSVLTKVPPSQSFDYGVHQWGLHADDKKVMEYLTQPLENLYVCGEAFSDYQGWVEGALRSANLILKEGFGIDSIAKEYKKEYGKGEIEPSDAIKKSYWERVTKNIQDIDEQFGIDSDDVIESGSVSKPNVAVEGTNSIGGRKPRTGYAVALSYFDRK
jgi:monoamine oxidase